MKKLIPIILITFLCAGNSFAYITDKEQKDFDEGIKRIERQKSNYKKDKEAKRQRELRKENEKRAKEKRQRELREVTKRNNRLTLEKKERDTEFNKRNSRNGCYLDEVRGSIKCK